MPEIFDGEIGVIQPQIEKPVGNGVEMDQSRPRETIAAEMDILAARREEFEERDTAWGEKAESLPEDQQDVLEEAEENDWQVDETILNSYPPEVVSLIREAKSLVDESEGMSTDEKRLKGEMAPYKKEEAQQKKEQLLSQVDYLAILDYYKNIHLKEKSNPGNTLFNTLSLLSRTVDFRHIDQNFQADKIFDGYKQQIDSLAAVSEGFMKNGFLKTGNVDEESIKGDQNQEEEVEVKRKEITDSLDMMIHDLKEYDYLSYDYGQTSTRHLSSPELEDIRWALNELDLIDVGRNLLEATGQYISKTATEYRKKGYLVMTDEDKKADKERIEKIETDNKIEFNGFETPKGTTAVIPIEELRQRMADFLPPDVLNGVKSIFHKTTREEKGGSDVDIKLCGSYTPFFDESGILAGANIGYYGKFSLPEDASPQEFALEKDEIYKSIFHEFGHHAHRKMSLEEFRNWEKVMKDDQTDLGKYSRISRQISAKIGKREDFAETFALFLTYPGVLQIISQKRFGFMVEYFDSRLKSKQKPLLKKYLSDEMAKVAIWKEDGLTADEIKELYYNQQG